MSMQAIIDKIFEETPGEDAFSGQILTRSGGLSGAIKKQTDHLRNSGVVEIYSVDEANRVSLTSYVRVDDITAIMLIGPLPQIQIPKNPVILKG